MKRLGLFLPVAAGVMWGSVGIFVRKLTDFGMDGVTVLESKMSATAIILFISIFIYKREWLRISLKDIWLFVCSGLAGMMLLNLCYNEAVTRLTLSFAAVLLSLSPIFVMLMAAAVFRERVTRRKILCTLMAILGCFLVSGVLETDGGRVTLPGIVIGLLAALFYALYSIFSKAAMKKGYNVFTITCYSSMVVALVLIPAADWEIIGAFSMEAPSYNVTLMIMHALFTAILPYVFYTAAFTYTDTGKASILAAGGEPAAAMVFGLLFFGERPTVLSCIGLVVTIVALAFICRPEKKDKAESRV